MQDKKVEMPKNEINTLSELQALFGEVGNASVRKEVSYLHPIYRQWIEASPFAVLATSGPEGLDASPRGDPASLVYVQDERTLLLPERRGNNRIDSLKNILYDPRVAMLFMIPHIGETLRVNGHARILAESALLAKFAVQNKPPQCLIEVKVQAVYFHCGRAILRSNLWQYCADNKVPTPGQILEALTQAEIDGAAYDQALPQRTRDTLY
jgi:PPOX class probable FMN-dependent enzyme